VAIYHLSVKTISRSQGRSATAAAAYRAGIEIVDERTGEIYDYTKKGGVLHSELILPSGENADRAEFWNSVEKHHKRGDAVLVREVEVALPAELTQEQRKELAVSFARELAERYGVAADIALHSPHTLTSRDLKNNPDQHQETDPETGRKHNGNWHAHIMLSACHVAQDGTLGKKAVELDPIHCQRAKIENMADRERVRWSELSNVSLEKEGHDSRVDHRSLKDQGIDREPTKHLGVEATNYERRTGEPSRKRLDFDEADTERLNISKEIIELETEVRQLTKETRQIKHAIIELESIEFERLREEKAAKRLEEENQAIAEYLELKRVEKIKEIVRAEAEKAAEKFKEKLAEKSTETDLKPQPEKQQPPKETPEQQEQRAQQALIDFDRQLREKWRKKENEILLNEANKHRERHKELNAKEPKSLWKGDKWAREHNAWVDGTNRIRQELIDTLEAAKNALEGKSAKEQGLQSQFEQVARESLKKHYPELDQVLTNKAEREQQVREEQRRERQREQERQKQERKLRPIKDQNLER
jgi:hypothetical protein